MEQHELLTEVRRILEQAYIKYSGAEPDQVAAHLVELRKLLDANVKIDSMPTSK